MNDLEKMEPTKQLDVVLEILLKGNEPAPCIQSAGIVDHLRRNLLIKANIRDVDLILVKLVKDEYATADRELLKGMEWNGVSLSDSKEPFYFITFPGKVHLQKGGYDQELRLQKRSFFQLQASTWITAIGTGLAGAYGLREILKWLVHHHFSH